MKPKRKRKPLSKSKPSKEPDAMDAAVDRPVSPNTIGDTDLGRRMADDLLGIGATETSQPVDERFEATVFMGVATSEPTPEPGATSWLLEFEGDTSIVLPSDDVVLGRHPEDTDDAMLIDVPDPMRRLSRTHARLRRDATNDIWTIEDMGSSNGVSLYDSDTRTWRRVSPRQPIIATEYVALGPLRARLARRDTKSPSATTT
ncbi:FHA domain-containing protein [Leucobacter zeae]|nr:FHA domain-containing protein [Leucobacter zeae]